MGGNVADESTTHTAPPSALAQALALRRAQATVPVGPDHVYLGEILPGPDEIKAVVRERRTFVRKRSAILVPEDRWAFRERHDVLEFEGYRDALGKRDRYLRALMKGESILGPDDSPALRTLLRVYDREKHSSDMAGWLNYLSLSPEIARRLQEPVGGQAFPDAVRKMHTLMAAGAGWGKSELIKALAFHDVVYGRAGVLVLDPHGDLVRQLARLPECVASDRVILVEPELRPGFTVGINPLDGSGLDDRAKGHVAAQLATALGELVSELSSNMRTVARASVRLLLDVPGATLFDLATVLAPPVKGRHDNPRWLYLVDLGKKHPDRTVAEFFNVEIFGDALESSKSAVRNRVLELLSLPDVAAMVGGKATLDLEAVLDARRVVLVNLAPLGSEGGAAMGRLLINMVAAMGRRRESVPEHQRVPVHVFVDEASTMVSPAMLRILTQLRKFGVHLTLAQQLGGSGFSGDARHELMQNTACKFAGGTDAGEIGRILQTDARDMPPLARGEFWVRWGTDKPVRLKVRRDLATRHETVQDAAWRDFRDRMVSDYYRSSKPSAAPAQASSAAPPPGGGEEWRKYGL